MQVMASTLIVLIVAMIAYRRGPYLGFPLLLLLTPMGMLAAVNLPAVGNMSILGSDIILLVLIGMILFRREGGTDLVNAFAPRSPGAALFLFLVYATFVTLFMPRVFAGETIVFSIGRVANQVGITSRPLAPGNGNLSQLMRMYISVSAFALALVAVRRRPDPQLLLKAMTWTTALHVALGLLDLATQATGTTWLLQPLRTANYSLTLGQNLGGLNRMMGGFPEPSAYGYFSLGMFGFWLGYWYFNKGTTRLPLVWMLLTAFVVLRSTSSSAYVAFFALSGLFLLRQLFRGGGISAVVSRQAASLAIMMFALLPTVAFTAYLLYELLPAVSAFVDRSLLNKLESDSGVERMSWNIQALQNFWDTWLLGAGLGSVRASNFIAALLGTVGIVGFVLMAQFILRTLRARPTEESSTELIALVAALQMGCAGFLVRALVVQGTPNLHVIFFAMAGCCVGLVQSSRDPVVAGEASLFRSQRRRAALTSSAGVT